MKVFVVSKPTGVSNPVFSTRERAECFIKFYNELYTNEVLSIEEYELDEHFPVRPSTVIQNEKE